MDSLDRLYQYAENGKIFVYCTPLNIAPAVTIREADGYNVALDCGSIHGERAERSLLIHELAHIATGAFYRPGEPLCYKQKMENRATKWAIEYLVPVEELEDAVAEGCTELWELAEHFDVTDEFMEQAVFYYKNGYLE